MSDKMPNEVICFCGALVNIGSTTYNDDYNEPYEVWGLHCSECGISTTGHYRSLQELLQYWHTLKNRVLGVEMIQKKLKICEEIYEKLTPLEYNEEAGYEHGYRVGIRETEIKLLRTFIQILKCMYPKERSGE